MSALLSYKIRIALLLILSMASFPIFAESPSIKLYEKSPFLFFKSKTRIAYSRSLEQLNFDLKDFNYTPKIQAYEHQQGFFCDFEDLINKKRKLNINLGLDGKQ